MSPAHTSTSSRPKAVSQSPAGRLRTWGSALAGVLLGLAGASCGDGSNAACVFSTGGCAGGGGGSTPGTLGAQAFPPVDGQLIRDGAPTVQGVFPGPGASTTTPIVIVFSESMAADSLDGAIRIQSSLDVLGQGGIPVVASTRLVGDGRVLVLVPLAALPASTTFEVTVVASATPTDLTGQALSGIPADRLLGLVSVGATNPTLPRLVAAFPADDASQQSTRPELVVVFDRPIQLASASTSSFALTVDGDPPAFPPVPTPLALANAGPFALTDGRAFTLRSVDADGNRVALDGGSGLAPEVVLTLSPQGAALLAMNGGQALATTTVSFQLAAISAPLSARLTSLPTDAIGIANLTAGDPRELALDVSLVGAAAGDRLGVFLFGTTTGTSGNTVALFRDIALAGTAPIATATFELADLDLVQAQAPLAARFADGSLALAFRLRRGQVISPVTVLDVAPDLPGIQDALLDTVRPQLVDLTSPGGGGDLFFSDQRDLVLSGRASERVRAATVETALGSTAALAPVVGATEDGGFLTAPVALDVVDAADLPLEYELTLFDAALNRSATPTAGLFSQRGVVGPTPVSAGGAVHVAVFDARSLAPIQGAVVVTHADAVGFPLVGSDVSDGSGLASVLAAGAGAAGTVLTVSALGFDNFTFHGITSASIGVPLTRVAPPSVQSTGIVTTGDTLASAILPLLARRIADTRAPESARPTFAGASCAINPLAGGALECPFGPVPVLTRRLGVQALLAGDTALTQATFSAALLVQGFSLRAPVLPALVGEPSDTTLALPFLLTAPGLPAAEKALEAPAVQFVGSLTQGLDFGSLVGELGVTGDPIVSLETNLPGVPGSAPVGLGLAFDQGGLVWNVRSAFPGAVVGGSLDALGAVDPDLLLRVEVRDTDGNRAGQRPRLSTLGDLILPAVLFPANVPGLLAQGAGTAGTPDSYLVRFQNSLLDIQLVAPRADGLYRVTLTDSTGRRWRLWRFDEPDIVGPIQLLVADIAALGGTPLQDGQIQFTVDTFAWPTLDRGHFLWSDVEREYDVFSLSAPTTFVQL